VAQRMVALHIDDGTQTDVVFDFGAGYGLDVPQQLGLGASERADVAGLSGGDFTGDGKHDLVNGFGGVGLWRYSDGAWSQLHTSGPGGLATGRLHLGFSLAAELHTAPPRVRRAGHESLQCGAPPPGASGLYAAS